MTTPTHRCGHPRTPGQPCQICHRESSRLAMAKARADGRPTAERHAGHDVTTTSHGRLYCRTCKRGEQDVDEMAVARAVAGDPPSRLTVAEREAAVAQLSLMGFGVVEIAQRVGCSRWAAWDIRRRLGLVTT